MEREKDGMAAENGHGLTDEMLVQEVKKGSQWAFTKLMKRYEKPVYNHIRQICYNHHLAQEITGDVFIQVYQSLNGFKGYSSFKKWLYRLTINTAIQRLRKLNKKRKIEFVSLSECQIEIEALSQERKDAILDELEKEELIEKAKLAIYELPLEYKTVAVLYYIDGFKHKEIAEVLKISLGTVKSRLFKATRKLRHKLAAYLYKVER